jgi:hypothetical protein
LFSCICVRAACSSGEHSSDAIRRSDSHHRSSGLFDSTAEDDLYERAAAQLDAESRTESSELAGQRGGRSSTSTLLPGYAGPSVDDVKPAKGGCWICGSLEHHKAFCPVWNRALANSSRAAKRKTTKGNKIRSPAAQPGLQRGSGLPQPRETRATSGARKVRPQHQASAAIILMIPIIIHQVVPLKGFQVYDCSHDQLKTQTIDLTEPKNCKDPVTDYHPARATEIKIILTDGDTPVLATQCIVRKTQEVTRCGGLPSFYYGLFKVAIDQPMEVTPQECRDALPSSPARSLYKVRGWTSRSA